MLQMVGSLNKEMNELKPWCYSFNRSYTNGSLSVLLLAGEHALTAQEVRNSLLSPTASPQFKESSEEEYLTSGK